MTSPWEAFRRTWMPRLERCQEAMGLVALVLPEVLPVVALLSAAELAGGCRRRRTVTLRRSAVKAPARHWAVP